ncbi:MAG: hypothetical protein SFY95_02780 [Planctomycetota bacterium]|nr:hypothetical protein [Planctomycetota bacterium]
MIVAWRWWPNPQGAVAHVDPHKAELVSQAAAILKPMPAKPLAEMLEGDIFERWITEAADIKPGDKATDDLLRETAEFLRMRFVNNDPAEYIAWRARKGYVWRPVKYMEQVWTVSQDVAMITGKPVAPGESLESLFSRLWPESHSGNLHNPNRGDFPKALVLDRRTVRVERGSLAAVPNRLPSIGGPDADVLWDGYNGGYLRRWWTWPKKPEDVVRDSGKVDWANVALVYEDRAGERGSLILLWFRDPSDRWWLWEISHGNGSRPRLSTQEY